MANRPREVRDLAKKRIATEEHDCTRALLGERSREDTTCNAIHFAVWRYLGNCTGQGRECSAASGETCRNSRTSRHPNDCTDSGCSQPARYDKHHAGVDHRSADANHHPGRWPCFNTDAGCPGLAADTAGQSIHESDNTRGPLCKFTCSTNPAEWALPQPDYEHNGSALRNQPGCHGIAVIESEFVESACHYRSRKQSGKHYRDYSTAPPANVPLPAVPAAARTNGCRRATPDVRSVILGSCAGPSGARSFFSGYSCCGVASFFSGRKYMAGINTKMKKEA
jgi:hypothetical protein